MAKLNARPVSFQEKIFDRLFDKAKMLARKEKRSVRQEDARLVGLKGEPRGELKGELKASKIKPFV